MGYKRVFLLVVFLKGISLFGQNTPASGNNFYVKIFQEFRITPIDIDNFYSSIPTVPVMFGRDDHLTGISIGSGLYFNIPKRRFSLSLSTSLRYDHVYFSMNGFNPVLENVKAFISDVHFEINKYMKVKRNFIQVGLGFSVMNLGTDYAKADFFETPNGDTAYWVSTGNFRFNTVNLLLGFQHGRLNFEVISRLTLSHQFEGNGNLLLPAIRLGYLIPLKQNL